MVAQHALTSTLRFLVRIGPKILCFQSPQISRQILFPILLLTLEKKRMKSLLIKRCNRLIKNKRLFLIDCEMKTKLLNELIILQKHNYIAYYALNILDYCKDE